MDNQNLRLLDQVQTQCMDVQDIRTQVQKTSKDQDETVVRVTISPSFGLWASPSGSLNKNSSKAIAIYGSLRQSEEESEIPNEMIKPTIRGAMIKNSNYIGFDSPQFSNLESPYKKDQGINQEGHVSEE